MSRIVIQGWLQVVVSIIGIWVAIITAGPALDAIGAMTAEGGLPSEFQTASGTLRVFFVVFVLCVLLTLLLVGFGKWRHTPFFPHSASNPSAQAWSSVRAMAMRGGGLMLGWRPATRSPASARVSQATASSSVWSGRA